MKLCSGKATKKRKAQAKREIADANMRLLIDLNDFSPACSEDELDDELGCTPLPSSLPK